MKRMLIVIILFLSNLVLAQDSKAADPDILKKRINFKEINLSDVNVISVYNKLNEVEHAENSGFHFNYEILCPKAQLYGVLTKKFKILAGDYSLREMLNEFKNRIPGFRWEIDGKSINIIIAVSRNPENAFDIKLTERLNKNISFHKLFLWADDKYPDCFFGGRSGDDASENYFKVVYVSTSGGMTVRSVANRISEKGEFRWLFGIFDNKEKIRNFNEKTNQINVGVGHKFYYLMAPLDEGSIKKEDLTFKKEAAKK